MCAAVQPKEDCPHIQQSMIDNAEKIAFPTSNDLFTQGCSVCKDISENWLCMTCNKLFCSRYKNGHMAEHNEANTTTHIIALSLQDLSYWCYPCESYITNKQLNSLRISFSNLKFGQLSQELTKPIKIEDDTELPPIQKQLELINKKINFQSKQLCSYSIIQKNDPDIEKIKQILIEKKFQSLQEQRALAVFIGLAIGDSLGANTEFMDLNYNRIVYQNGFQDHKEDFYQRCKAGQWTDDTSMALCLADSLLKNNFKFAGVDIRHRFISWWHFGYNNGLNDCSFGLGGNIMKSFYDFYANQTDYVPYEKGLNSGNGSIMRLAPVPICFHDNIQEGMRFAANQSLTTHDGDEARDCCKLLTFLIIKLINRTTFDYKHIFDELGKTFIEEHAKNEKVALQVQALSQSQSMQSLGHVDPKYNEVLADVDWNWKKDSFQYSPTRVQQCSAYIGSYVMDAMTMALHIAYTSSSFNQMVFRCANMGGDSDTVGAVVGQIAGAIYGYSKEVEDLYQVVNQWDHFGIPFRAYKLFHKIACHTIQSK